MSHLTDIAIHFWDELTSRSSGPYAFRFILQPIMAAIQAIRDGRHDANAGRTPYLWTIIHVPELRWSRLAEGLHAVARVLCLGVAMDALYQFTVLKAFRPLEMINIVLLLAFVPYLFVRGPTERIVRWRRERSEVSTFGGPG